MIRRAALLFVALWAVWSCLDPSAASRIGATALVLRGLWPDWITGEPAPKDRSWERESRAVQEHFDRLRERAGRDAGRFERPLRTTWILTRDDESGAFLVPLGSQDGIEPGAPVVVNDVLLGQVSEVTERVSEVLPLWHPEVAVRGQIAIEEGRVCEIIVGGPSSRPGAIEARFPSLDRESLVGQAITTGVPIGPNQPPAGLRIGTLLPAREGVMWRRATRFAISPTVDPRAIDIVAIPVEAAEGIGEQEPVQRQARSILGLGDDAPERRSLALWGGTFSGHRIGLGVASGPALVGTIHECGLFSSTVRRLDDPGYRLRVVAVGEGEPRGRVLVALGRGSEGVRMWIDGAPFEGAGPFNVATSGFRSGVPRGLLVGRFRPDQPGGRVGWLEPAAAIGGVPDLEVLEAEPLPERFRLRYR
ncbi:MAG: rod shape-determining protein MreC [Planctomycetota bacterium]